MITVTGSLAFDHIMDFEGKFADHIMPDKIHQINLSFLVNNLSKQRGGTAGNIAYNLALLECPTAIFATAGEDFDEYASFLKQAGIDISSIQIVKDKSTASAFIMTDLADNQITAFHPGAMSDSANYSLNNLAQKPDLVVIAPNHPQAMVKFAQECQDANIPYMLDPGMQLPRLSESDLRNIIAGAIILIGNDYEISLLKEKVSLDKSQLLKQVKILITTLGEKGSVIQTKDQKIEIQAGKPKEIVDPTGAGDAYRAGFLAGFIKDLDLKVCGQIGSVAACYAIEKYGTTNHAFSMEEFKQRYKENFEELNL